MTGLFGTDGIRGVANDLLTGDFAFRLSLTMAELMRCDNLSGEVYIGKDPRMSSDMLEHAIASGFMSRGFNVVSTGVIPTAGLSYITKLRGGVLGVMISASHNQIQDNGVKFFNRNSMKLDENEEQRIENAFNDMLYSKLDLSPIDLGLYKIDTDVHNHYLTHLSKVSKRDLKDMRVVLDTAHGSACGYADEIFTHLGAQTKTLHETHDGRKINVDCGSNYPALVQNLVKESDVDLGVAFDGDADRAILIDENGELVNGDQILAMWGLYLISQNNLKKNTIVGTVLSNQGLESVLERNGGHLVRTDVGDKYIMRKMVEEDYEIGGEQSGHIIFMDHNVTGDGIATALKVAELMKITGEPLSKLADAFTPYPQVALNVPTTDKSTWKNDEELKELLNNLEKDVKDKANGRILVRESGTQPLIRIMVEAEEASVANEVAEKMYASLKGYLEKNGMLLVSTR